MRSADGTQVGYELVRPACARGHVQTIVYGYGGSNMPFMPTYAGHYGRMWLERGGVLAVAQVRGGGERGAAWYLGGVG